VVWRVVSGLHGVSQVRQSRCSGVFNDRNYISEQEDGYQLGILMIVIISANKKPVISWEC